MTLSSRAEAARAFAEWERLCGIVNQSQGAQLLGIDRGSTYRKLVLGDTPTRTQRLAMAAIAAGLPAYGENKPLEVDAVIPRGGRKPTEKAKWDSKESASRNGDLGNSDESASDPSRIKKPRSTSLPSLARKSRRQGPRKSEKSRQRSKSSGRPPSNSKPTGVSLSDS